MPSSRWSTPSTGSMSPMERTTSSAWRAEPALLSTTPTTSTGGRAQVRSPWMVAAMVREAEEMSTTSTTGVRVRAATWAVEAKPSPPIWPS